MRRRGLAIAIVLAGCRGGADEGKGQAPAQLAEKKPAPAADPAAAGPAGIDPEMRAFCVRSMSQMMTCFRDESFWDVYATTFFAGRDEQIVDPERKQLWIGMQKDAVVALARDKEFEANCDMMLAENKLPTATEMKVVDDARAESCTAFGAALGWMIFGQGSFYAPRDGSPPPVIP